MDVRKKERQLKGCFMAARGRSGTDTGFTLIEITFALVILAGSLVVLIGLQTSVIGRSVRDSNRLQAMMLSRMILSSMESSDIGIAVQDIQGSIPEILESNFALDPADRELLEELSQFQGRLLVEEWEPTPDLVAQFGLQFSAAGPIMKKVTLVVTWSEHPADTFEVIYFVPLDA